MQTLFKKSQVKWKQFYIYLLIKPIFLILAIITSALYVARKIVVRTIVKVTLLWAFYNTFLTQAFPAILTYITWKQALCLIIFHHILKMKYSKDELLLQEALLVKWTKRHLAWFRHLYIKEVRSLKKLRKHL